MNDKLFEIVNRLENSDLILEGTIGLIEEVERDLAIKNCPEAVPLLSIIYTISKLNEDIQEIVESLLKVNKENKEKIA